MLTGLQRTIFPRWSPAQLKPSLWIDASKPVGWHSAIAGTGGITDGGAVGFCKDRSGNNFDLTAAADDTTRPTYRWNNGLPYLEFNGTNQALRRLASLGMYASVNGNSIFAAARLNTTNTQTSDVLVCEGASGDADTFYGIAVNSAVATTLQGIERNDAGTVLLTLGSAGSIDDTDKVVGFVDTLAVASFYIAQNIAAGPTGYTRSGALTPNRFSLGAYVGIATGGWMSCRVYELVIVPRVLSSDEVRKIVTYLGAKAGPR